MFFFLKKYQNTLASCLLLLASVSVYLNILPNPFIWSEESVIVDNPTFKDLSYLPKFFTINYWLNEHPFSGIHIFRPIRAVTFTLEYALWGLNPLPYHLFNIFLHTATTFVIYFIFKNIIKSQLVAFLTALFFAVHPVHTEAITWTMSRDDIMGTLFPLIAWWFFIKRVSVSSSGLSSGNSLELSPRRIRLFLYIGLEMFFFTLGLLSREMAAVFPLLLVLYVFCFCPRKKWKKNLLATLPYWLINFVYLFIHFYFWWGPLSVERFSIKPPLFNHALLVGKTIGFYLRLLLLPVNLSADHYFPFFVSLAEPETPTLVAFFLFFAGLTLYFLSKGLNKLFFSLAFTILSLLPAANIILVTGRPVGEQRLYLPSIGFCFLTALIFQRIKEKLGCHPERARASRRIPIRLFPFGSAHSASSSWPRGQGQNDINGVTLFLTTLLVSFYAFVTIQRNFDWRSPLALWESAVRTSPLTERAHRNLAGSYLATGQEDKAILEFETILNLQEEEKARCGIKIIYDGEPQPIGALATPIMPVANEKEICEMREKMEEEERMKMVSPNAEIHKYLGDAYKRRDDLRHAAYEYNMAIVYDSASFESYNELGIVYDMAGFTETAIAVLEKGTQIKPDFFPLYQNLGVAHGHAEDYQKAIENYEKVIELEASYNQPHLRLAIIYAKSKVDKEKARIHWDKYLELTLRPEEKYVKEMERLLK